MQIAYNKDRERKLPSRVLRLFFAGLVLCTWSGVSMADESEIAGTIEATVNGQQLQFPSLSSSINVSVQGDLARVSVTQRFQNPTDIPVNARYLFPLNKDAAVFSLTMNVGSERIRAVVKKKQDAQKTYEAAQRAGKAAVLLTQHRPNMFTQRLSNLMPGLPIEIVLEYTQTVAKVDGSYELVVPLAVGPRYSPEPSVDGFANTLARLPLEAPIVGVHLPKTVDTNRVSLNIQLRSPVGFLSVNSKTHPIQIDESEALNRRVTLASASTLPNRDFVLRYQLGQPRDFAGGVLSHADQRGGFFSVLIEPPQYFAEDQVVPREMVFLLDCSGSMSGAPMRASKAFMREVLKQLRPADTFRIIRFSDHATEFSREPLQATPQNIQRGLIYTNDLSGSGGTVMRSGVEQALMVPQRAGFVRNVVFLTDGYIGNEFEILGLVARELDDARLFALGVGSGVNRYLLDELARTGRGFARYLDPTLGNADLESEAKALSKRLQTPLLTDLVIDWGDAQPTAVTPAGLPDLYAGDSLRVQGRYENAGQFDVVLSGRSGEQRVSLPLRMTLKAATDTTEPAGADGSEAIALIWARSAVKDAMHQLSIPQQLRINEQSENELVAQITNLGLDYSLATRWTSFVAVSEQIVNPNPELAKERSVPGAKVAGVSRAAYSSQLDAAQIAPASPHGGYAAPEPSTWLGLALLVLLLMLWFGLVRPEPVYDL